MIINSYELDASSWSPPPLSRGLMTDFISYEKSPENFLKSPALINKTRPPLETEVHEKIRRDVERR